MSAACLDSLGPSGIGRRPPSLPNLVRETAPNRKSTCDDEERGGNDFREPLFKLGAWRLFLPVLLRRDQNIVQQKSPNNRIRVAAQRHSRALLQNRAECICLQAPADVKGVQTS